MDARFEEILREVGEIPDDVSLSSDQRLKEDLDVDSLALIDFVVQIESQLGVTLSEDRLTDVHTVGDLWGTVDQAVAA